MKTGFHLLFLLTILALSAKAQITFTDDSGEIPFDRDSWIYGGDGLAGSAWFDYNNDGNIDVYLTNGKTQPNSLYRNNGDGTFTDVAAFAGVDNGDGNSAAIAGDIDNDGWMDLFLAGDGSMMSTGGASSVKMYRNLGNGTFEDITATCDVSGGITHLSSAFGDIDNDGYIDLYVSACGSLANGQQHISKIYRNDGDLTFTALDIPELSMDSAKGACIAFFTDYNDDGFIDLFVGNCNDINLDAREVELYENTGSLDFVQYSFEKGLTLGLWMGFAPGDYDNDGDIDIFVTNVGDSYPGSNAKHAFYENNGDGTYTDIADVMGLDTLEWGWGTVMEDFDNDGWQDLFFTGSMPLTPFSVVGSPDSVGCTPGERPANPGHVLFNNGDDTWTDYIPLNMSCFFTTGVSSADYNNDGFVDLMTNVEPFGTAEGSPFLLKNDGNSNNYICIKLVGHDGINKAAIGSRVTVTSGGMSMTKEIYAGSSFISMNSPWLNFGLGTNTSVDDVVVRWPDGSSDTFAGTDVTINQCNTLNTGGFTGLAEVNNPLTGLSVFPNPMNETAVIRFDLDQPGTVALEILDLTGKQLSVFDLGQLPKGNNQFVFDGKGNNGNALTSGFYLYRLTTGGSSASGSMIIAR